jgi:hypothetical protein
MIPRSSACFLSSTSSSPTYAANALRWSTSISWLSIMLDTGGRQSDTTARSPGSRPARWCPLPPPCELVWSRLARPSELGGRDPPPADAECGRLVRECSARFSGSCGALLLTLLEREPARDAAEYMVADALVDGGPSLAPELDVGGGLISGRSASRTVASSASPQPYSTLLTPPMSGSLLSRALQ